MKIALFGGSFNPVHLGHTKIAQFAYKELKLDKFIFIPTAISPFKKNAHAVAAEDRINMLKLALKNLKGNFEISEFETKRGGVSYTFETIRYFKQKYPNDELYWIMGSDLVNQYHKWEYAEEMAKTCQFVIFKRNNKPMNHNFKTYNMQLLKNEMYPESSTEVRAGRLEYTSEEVNKYIGEHFLYAKEIIHSILSAKRAKHCAAAAEYAAEMAKAVKYDAKVAYYAGLFHDVCKELSEEDSRDFITSLGLQGNNKSLYPKHVLHQVCGALWLKYCYCVNNEAIVHAVEVHTTLNMELSILDKIIFVADKICDGRAFDGIQKLRALTHQDFAAGFAEVVKRAYQYNLDKGIIFNEEQEKIYQKWMKVQPL